MPTYDYECRACGHRFEHWQQMTDKRLRVCPACRKPRLHRLVGAGGGLLFKGSGFYATDYKKKGADGAGTGGAGESAPKGADGGGAATPAPESAPGKGSAPARKAGAPRSGKGGAA